MHVCVRLDSRRGDVLAARGHAYDPSARRDETSVLVERGTGVIERDVLVDVADLDRHALFVAAGIAARRQNHADRRHVVPLDLDFAKPLVDDSVEDLVKIGLEARQHDLRLGVAEARVVFEHLDAVRGQHQSEIEHALERASLGVHRLHRRQNDVCHRLGGDVVRVCLRRRERAHAAGVRALVVVIGALVVLRGHHRDDGLAVGEREHGHLFAGQKFLDDDDVARRLELFVDHHLFEGFERLFFVVADDDALAQREPVRLDDERILRALGILARRRIVVELAVVGGRDAVLFHQFFGERLGRLDDSRILMRTERAEAVALQHVDHAHRERIVGRDHRHHDVVVRLDEPEHSFEVGRRDRSALRDLRNAGVAGQTIEFVDVFAL